LDIFVEPATCSAKDMRIASCVLGVVTFGLATVALVLSSRAAEACSPAVEQCVVSTPFSGQVAPVGVQGMPFAFCNGQIDDKKITLEASDHTNIAVSLDVRGLSFRALTEGMYTMTVPNPAAPGTVSKGSQEFIISVSGTPAKPSVTGVLTAPVTAVPAVPADNGSGGCGGGPLAAGQAVSIDLALDEGMKPWAPLVAAYSGHFTGPGGKDWKREGATAAELGFENRCLGDNNQLPNGHYTVSVTPIFVGASISTQPATAEFDLACDRAPGSNPEGKPLTDASTGGCNVGAGFEADWLGLCLVTVLGAAAARRRRTAEKVRA
jgi:hypothetical protein